MTNDRTSSSLGTPGQLATQLILELRDSSIALPRYNHALTHAIIAEQHSLEHHIDQLVLDDAARSLSAPSQVPPMFTLATIINRNKRCLLAYHEHRLTRIKDLFWEGGGALHHILADAQFKNSFSPSEVEFLKAYSASVQVYQSDVGLPLFSPIEDPPKSLYANVRVIRECGKISMEHGMVDLKKGIR